MYYNPITKTVGYNPSMDFLTLSRSIAHLTSGPPITIYE